MAQIPRLHKETSLFNRTRTFSSTFKILADSITSLVKGTETYTDPVTGETKTNTFGTLLQQTANNVLIKATKSASTAAQGGQAIIESLINVAPEGIKIAASKVNIEGAAIFTSGKLSKVVVASSKQWYSSTSPTSRTGGEWVTTQPNITAGRYLWERTYYTYSDGTNEYKPSSGGVCVTAPTDIGGTVTGVDVEYAQGTSPTTAPTSGWATDAPTITAGRYLWTRTKTTYSDGTSEYTKTACISGDNGKLVTSAKEQYYLSTSSTAQSGGSWTDACPAWESGKYIWTRTHLTYADGTTGAANVTLATALNEANRKANATITGVDVEYADSTSSTTPPSSGWQTSAPTWQAGHYIWQRTKTVTPTGTAYSQPTCISGRDGADGAAAYTYSIDCNPSALVRAANGTLSPASVAFAPVRAQGTSNPAAYAGRMVISEYNGSTWTDRYTSSGDELYKTYRPTATAKVVRCNLYLAGGTDTLLDTQSVPIVSNGANGTNGTNGKDGTSVTVSKIEYGVADNASTAPTYSTTVPTSIAKGKWLWVKTTYSDGTTAVNKSYVGTDGEDGTSIYVTSSSKTGGTTTVKLSDGTTLTIVDGEDGSNGTAGKNGYVHTAWANSSDGSQGFSTTISANKLYLGVYTDNTAADSTDYTKYSWSLIKGADGAKGADGKDGTNGVDGKDAYTVLLTNESHTFAGSATAAIASSTTSQVIAFKGATQVAATIGSITGAPEGMSTSISNNGTSTATFTVSVTTSLTTRQGVLTVPVTVDGKSFSLKFSWSLALTGAKGAKGDAGADGLGISSIVEQYYLSSSDTARVDGAWSATPPAWVKGKYYWTRSKITWSDNTVTYTDPVLANDVTSIANIAGGAVKKSTQLWYTKADTTPPLAPTSKVTSTSTAGGAWRMVVPTYSDSYPVYFYCWQYEAMDGTVTWSDVVLDNVATENQGNVRGAQARSQRIWCSTTSGTNTLSGNTTWVTNINSVQNSWTATRPPYNANYPVIWTAIQSQTVAQQAKGSACTCTTPVKDNTTVINGDQITTGTIDASKVAVTNLDARNITSGTIDAARIGANSIAIGKLSSDVQTKLGNIDRETAYRGVCSTAADDMNKYVSCTGFELKTGATVVVYNTKAQTYYGNVTLNVNNTGWKNVYVGNGIVDIGNLLLWAAGSSITYVYDGTYWVVADSPGSWKGSECNASESTAAKTTSCGKIVIFKGASIKVPMAYRNTSSDATLNVQSLGRYVILFGNTGSAPTYSNGYTWKPDSLVEFVFDGLYWRTGSRTYIDGGDIVTGTIDANRIDVNALKANIVEALEIRGEQITGGVISGVQIVSEGTIFSSSTIKGYTQIIGGSITFGYLDYTSSSGEEIWHKMGAVVPCMSRYDNGYVYERGAALVSAVSSGAIIPWVSSGATIGNTTYSYVAVYDEYIQMHHIDRDSDERTRMIIGDQTLTFRAGSKMEEFGIDQYGSWHLGPENGACVRYKHTNGDWQIGNKNGPCIYYDSESKHIYTQLSSDGPKKAII